MNRVWNYLYTLVVAGFLTGCALGGTEAGNPTMNSETTYEPISGQYAQYLLDTVCAKYSECYANVSTTNCSAGVLDQTNLAQGFGLGGSFGTAREMVNAERSGSIQGDYSRVVNCVTEIRQLSCFSNAVSSASPQASPNTSAAYSGVINMIPTSGTSCAGVF